MLRFRSLDMGKSLCQNSTSCVIILLTLYIKLVVKLGYARISTENQRFDRQIESLTASGVERIYQDIESGGRRKRGELDRMLEQLRTGDLVVVETLDRLSRSLRDLLEIVETINKQGADFESLNENIDTSSASGKLMFHIFGVIAEFERARIKERVRHGITVAAAKGRKGGRPRVLTSEQAQVVIEVRNIQRKSISECARIFGVSRRTISRVLSES